jgi:hypothetical protein
MEAGGKKTKKNLKLGKFCVKLMILGCSGAKTIFYFFSPKMQYPM